MSSTASSEIHIPEGMEKPELRKTPSNVTRQSMTSLQKISSAITGSLEKFFFRWGYIVALHPKKAIFSCLLITAISSVGLWNFHIENRPDRLWIPRYSEFSRNTEWMRSNFPSPIRTSWALITADNVLKPEVMREIVNIHEKVKHLQTSGGKRWKDLCYKLPVTKFFSRRKRRSLLRNNEEIKKNHTFHTGISSNFEDAFTDEFFGSGNDESSYDDFGFGKMMTVPSVPDDFYCSIMETLDEECWEVNPAELWSFNRTVIDNLTEDEIVQTVNHELNSPIFGRPVNYTVELGGNIVRNEKGEIISAESVLIRWMVGVNQTILKQGNAKNDNTGEIADEDCLEWELKWIELMKNVSRNAPPGVGVHFVNLQSWMEISEATLLEDGIILALGFIIMFFYVGIMLGRFNAVEQRPFLTLAGLTCVGLACIVSYGICSLFYIDYGPVNKILPFLLLGIGVDDMFVIMQCWNNLFSHSGSAMKKFSIPERMGMAMKHAGVSITVTSLTDVAAFGVGALTILPGLQSFCIYAAVGIIAVFIFQATYFVAWFSLDQKRVEARRNAFFPWIIHDERHCSQNKGRTESVSQTLFGKILPKFLFMKWTKVAVIGGTLSMLGITIYGNVLLRQEFDPMWFLPDDSYMSQYMKLREEYYPGTGYPAVLVANQVNWSQSLNNFGEVLRDLEESKMIYKLENWYDAFKEYTKHNFNADLVKEQLTESQFRKYMGKFLYSPTGSKYRAFFKVENHFGCGESLPSIVNTAVMPFRFKKFNGPKEHIPGLIKVEGILKTSNVSFNKVNDGPTLFVWGTGLTAWKTDQIISAELYRNVALSLICVLVTTFLLLANFRVCMLCGICVVFTVVNVGGFMHFWGLTIDTVSCIDVVLGIGLCVDYAAHIALAFMTRTGSRESRAKSALKDIGPAVLNGGFSTFLAILLLANSQSHAFKSFFKIFTVVIMCGLFHGLIFLPVVLSICGPDPYPFAYSQEDDFNSIEEDDDHHSHSSQKVVEMKEIHKSLLNVSSHPKDNRLFSNEDSIFLTGHHTLEVDGNERTQQ